MEPSLSGHGDGRAVRTAPSAPPLEHVQLYNRRIREYITKYYFLFRIYANGTFPEFAATPAGGR